LATFDRGHHRDGRRHPGRSSQRLRAPSAGVRQLVDQHGVGAATHGPGDVVLLELVPAVVDPTRRHDHQVAELRLGLRGVRSTWPRPARRLRTPPTVVVHRACLAHAWCRAQMRRTRSRSVSLPSRTGSPTGPTCRHLADYAIAGRVTPV
jgi:hypothetical protein